MNDPWIDLNKDPEARHRWKMLEEEGIAAHLDRLEAGGLVATASRRNWEQNLREQLIELREGFGPCASEPSSPVRP